MTARALLPDLPAFAELKAHATALKPASIEQLLQADPGRVQAFSLEAAGLQLDYSKHLLDPNTLSCLLKLAEQSGLRKSIDDLLSGAHVNNTEG